MTEYNNFNMLNNSCRACLSTCRTLHSVTLTEFSVFKKFMDQVLETENNINVCSYCRCILRKMVAFIEQCKSADSLIHQVAMGMDTKLNLPSHMYTTSRVETYYIGPDCDDDKCDDDLGDVIDDDDDMPLVMLKDDKLKPEIEEMKIEVDIDSKKIKKKRKKLPKEGFSSRMVQETNEYLVIKLTKTQVLQELLEKSRTENYIRSPYKCEKCYKAFNFEDVLVKHMEKHTLQHGTYLCDICSQYCPTPVSLRGHMKSHTTRYKCKICLVVRLSRQHLLEHYALAHTDRAVTYTCDKCDFTTNKRTVIQRHVKCHSSSERHACDKCGKLFNTIESLRVHTMRHDKSKCVQCPHCDKNLIYPSLLHKHIQTVHEKRELYCVECDVHFKSQESLRLHFKKAKRHRDASSYKYSCTQCVQKFVSTAALATHLSATHGQTKRHICNICDRKYSSTDALRSHSWRVHTHKSENVTCEICEKRFPRKSMLKAHLREHVINESQPAMLQKPATIVQNTKEIPLS